MAKLADARDLKSAGPKGLWGFDSPSRHQLDCGIVSGRSETRKMEHLLPNPQRDSGYTLLLHLKALGIVNVLPEKSDSSALAGVEAEGMRTPTEPLIEPSPELQEYPQDPLMKLSSW